MNEATDILQIPYGDLVLSIGHSVDHAVHFTEDGYPCDFEVAVFDRFNTDSSGFKIWRGDILSAFLGRETGSVEGHVSRAELTLLMQALLVREIRAIGRPLGR